MGKVIFWVVVIIGGLFIARILAHQSAQEQAAARQPKQKPRRNMPPIQHPESMVRCEHCGIHLPRSEAVLISGQTWCSQEHAKLGKRV
ncbi:MAG: PP0621 family protein [Paralcaligenes sp.]